MIFFLGSRLLFEHKILSCVVVVVVVAAVVVVSREKNEKKFNTEQDIVA